MVVVDGCCVSGISVRRKGFSSVADNVSVVLAVVKAVICKGGGDVVEKYLKLLRG